jgi:hypothetical protein
MSTKRLTAEERATYLLGHAALRQLSEAPRDFDTQQEISAFCRWVTHWLTEEELACVTTNTGYLFDDEDVEELFGPSEFRPSRPRQAKPDSKI